ncbi:MAG: (d)CMP kinase [Nanoarchaeota archaeon]
MILTLNGKGGSGKSTVARILAQKLDFKHYSSGDFMRSLARERGLSLLELSKLAESDKSIDEEIDRRQIKLGEKEDDFIIDARLAAHFIPDSVKIFLECDDMTRAKRILAANRSEEDNPDIDTTIANIRTREASEVKRYGTYYGFNPYDVSNYDLVIDTSTRSPEEIADMVLDHIKRKEPPMYLE